MPHSKRGEKPGENHIPMVTRPGDGVRGFFVRKKMRRRAAPQGVGGIEYVSRSFFAPHGHMLCPEVKINLKCRNYDLLINEGEAPVFTGARV